MLQSMLRRFPCLLIAVLLLGTLAARGQDDATAKNAARASELLNQMIKALGGDLWLDMPNYELWGTTSTFFEGKPTGVTTSFWYFHQAPDQDRFEYSKHRDVVQIYTAHEGWEIIYRGMKQLPKDQVDDFLRRRAHSIETVIHAWLPDPKTILTYDGQQLAERHLADQVTLLSANNDVVTLQLDAETHLPLRRIFRWRDPTYKDFDEDIEEYDNYRVVDGIETPYSITRFHNGDMVHEQFLLGAQYDRMLPADEFDPQATARKIVK
uniref:Outer membrane lipoprotein-sorting protein n=1 Tax=mine drainage metagenome TaxID=410659 RepID=E6QLQ3_9ZZZZ